VTITPEPPQKQRDRQVLLKERKELLEAKAYRDHAVMLEGINSRLSRSVPSALQRRELLLRQGELTAKIGAPY